MSQNKKIIDEFIEYIDSSIHAGLDQADFIKNFRSMVEEYLRENLL